MEVWSFSDSDLLCFTFSKQRAKIRERTIIQFSIFASSGENVLSGEINFSVKNLFFNAKVESIDDGSLFNFLEIKFFELPK